MKFSNIFSLLLVTFLFSGTQADKINLSKQFSKSNPQEKRVVQFSCNKYWKLKKMNIFVPSKDHHIYGIHNFPKNQATHRQ